jgi:hypothetical protein
MTDSLTHAFRRALFGVIAILVAPLTIAFAGQSTDRTAVIVREVLLQYSTALASLDADAVKKVQPSIDAESLKRAFREMKALEVAIDTIKVLSSEPAMARVSCRVTQTLTPKAGSKRSTAVTRVLRLRRLDTGWVIDSFER